MERGDLTRRRAGACVGRAVGLGRQQCPMMTAAQADARAKELDARDPLAPYRAEFCIPRVGDVTPTRRSEAGECVYLVGNSLGLMPKATRAAVVQELDDWARLGVEGHFHAQHPWYPYHEELRAGLAHVVGAQEKEVVAMNSLTTNLHLLMASFYRPTRERFKIVIEDGAFSSDSYAVQSQVEWHARHAGFDAGAGLVRLCPRAGESTLRTADILETIDREKDSIALLMLSGVNYLTGQRFDMEAITAFARARGIVVGWDLAHAAGNVELALHDWGCDFAAWCHYKYLNSGPGAVAGAFVHERHLGDATMPRLAGWWGNDPATRFRMEPTFIPVARADAWALSNPPVLALAPVRVSLGIFARATMASLCAKSRALTEFADALLRGVEGAKVVTPVEATARGCQFSLRFDREARGVHEALGAAGVVADFREPDVIRVAPVPLYNSFGDVARLALVLRDVLGAMK